MTHPISLPNKYDLIREEAERFQKLSFDEKLRIIAEMMYQGNLAIENSPNRDQIRKQQEEEERAWQLTNKRLIDEYEAKQKSMS
ncbi:MAG: hypothetical protein QM703_00050 [Gemmatales bacterium]